MPIKGSVVDANTRWTHYHSELDIIAIKMKCCNEFYACIYCHNEATNHEPTQWAVEEHTEKAILCGECKTVLTITEYLTCNSICPNCTSRFNPKCSNHYPFYFEVRRLEVRRKEV